MEALAAIGLAGNVLQFVEFAATLFERIKEFSSDTAQAPKSIQALGEYLGLVLNALKDLNNTDRACLEKEKVTIQLCVSQAEALLKFLDKFRLKIGAGEPRWISRRRADLDKIWKTSKSVYGEREIEKFRLSLDRLLTLIAFQLQARNARKSEQTLTILSDVQGWMKAKTDAYASNSEIRPKFIVPQRRNAAFVGRRAFLDELVQKFASPGNNQKIATLYGLGGVGKSQIALEYAYVFKEKEPGSSSVFWVHAGNADRFEEAYKRIALECDVAGRENPKLDLMQLVRDYLEKEHQFNWLMIVDNVDDASTFFRERSSSSGKTLSDYIPKTSKGSVLYTTRSRHVAVDLTPDRDPVEVSFMSPAEGRKLIGEKFTSQSSEEVLLELLEELDHLPLAIIQASSYMDKRRITPERYLEMYRTSDSFKISLLSHEFADHGKDIRPMSSVAATWMLSFEHIRSENPRAADVLSLMSFLDRQRIPHSLLEGEYGEQYQLQEAIGTLEAFSLVTANDKDRSYNMHRLVQLATRAWLAKYDEFDGEKWPEKALTLLSMRFPDGEYETWTTCASYLPHSEAVLRHKLNHSSDAKTLERARLLFNTSWYFGMQGHFSASHKRAEESFLLREKVLGHDHPDATASLERFAIVLTQEGEYHRAEKLLKKILETREKTLGKEHVDTFKTLEALGSLLFHKGDYEAAAEVRTRVFSGREKFFGKEHLETLKSLNLLTWAVRWLSKFEEAEMMAREAAEIGTKTLGEGHPETLMSQHNIAIILRDQGKYRAAEILLRRVLKVAEENLGIYNPITVSYINNLGVILEDQGKCKEAESYHKRGQEYSTKIYGAYHRDTLLSMENVAWSLENQQNFEAAEEIFLATWNARRKTLGECHPGTLDAVMQLGKVMHQQKKYEAAEELLGQVLQSIQQGQRNHPAFIRIAAHLAANLCARGKHGDAENLLKQALEEKGSKFDDNDIWGARFASSLALSLEGQGKIQEAISMRYQAMEMASKALGKWNAETLRYVNELAKTLRESGNLGEAELIQRRLLEENEKNLGILDERTLASMHMLAMELYNQERYEDAEPLFRQVWERRETALGNTNRSTLASSEQLALTLQCLRRYEEAQRICSHTIEGLKTLLGDNNPSTLASTLTLASIHKDQDQYQEAEKIYREVLSKQTEKLGQEHRDTLNTAYHLACVLQSKGNYEESEEIFRRVLQSEERDHGPDHEDTLLTVYHLAYTLQYQGKCGESEQLYRRVLQGEEKTHGPEHKETLTTVYQLGLLLDLQGKERKLEAELLYRRAFEGREKLFGKHHADTCACANSLAWLIVTLRGHDEEVEKLFRLALESSEMRDDEVLKLVQANNLAKNLWNRGLWKDAETLLRRVVNGHEARLDDKDPKTLDPMAELAFVLAKQSKNAEAEVIYQRVISRREVLGSNTTIGAFQDMADLALVLLRLQKYQESEEMYRRAIDGYTNLKDWDEETVIICVIGLVVVLTALGKKEEMRVLVRQALDKGGDAIPPDFKAWLQKYGLENGWSDDTMATAVLGRLDEGLESVSEWLRSMVF